MTTHQFLAHQPHPRACRHSLKQVSDFYRNASDNRSFKALAGATIVLHVFGALLPSTKGYFAVSPAHFFGGARIWTLATAGFYEYTPAMGVVNLLILLLAGPYFCTKWGSDKVLVRFILIVNACVFATTLALLSALSFMPTCYYAHSCGLVGTSAAIVVALKQAFGDRPLAPYPVVESIKAKVWCFCWFVWMAVLHCTLSAVMLNQHFYFSFPPPCSSQHLPIVTACFSAAVLFLAGYGKELPLMLGGTFFAWFYLRFFRVDVDTQVVGDPREEFAFATLFPSPMHPFVSALSALALRSAVGLGFFKHATSEANRALSAATASVQSFDSLHTITADGGTGAAPLSNPDAERRRALAIKAIDAKLAALSASAPLVNGSGALVGLSVDATAAAAALVVPPISLAAITGAPAALNAQLPSVTPPASASAGAAPAALP